MAITHELTPNLLIDAANILSMTEDLRELSDGSPETGMIVDSNGNGSLVAGFEDLSSEPTQGSTITLNISSFSESKATLSISISYNEGQSYQSVAEYTVAETNTSSFELATYDASAEISSTNPLNSNSVNNILVRLSLSTPESIVQEMDITIDSPFGGRIQIGTYNQVESLESGRVFILQVIYCFFIFI